MEYAARLIVYDYRAAEALIGYCMVKKAARGKTRVIEAVGWYGVAAILLAYVLVSFNIVSAQSWEYQLLNFTGASGVLVISYIKQARQLALLNLVWAVIALATLIGLALK